MHWFWLSFADKGGCVIAGTDPQDAIAESWRLEINPGGEVLVFSGPLVTEPNALHNIPPNQLHSVERLQEMGGVVRIKGRDLT